MACPALQTCQAHRRARHSIRMSSCKGSPHQAAYSIVHKLLWLGRWLLECTGTIPSHRQDKLSPYTRPCSTQILYCKWSCSVCWLTVDTEAFYRYRSLDRGSRCRCDTYRPTSKHIPQCSMVLAMDYNSPVASAYTAFRYIVRVETSDNSKCPCSLLPSHNRIPHPDLQRHYRKWPVVALIKIINEIKWIKLLAGNKKDNEKLMNWVQLY